MINPPTFGSARERTIWVQAALRMRNSSFAKLAQAHGWGRSAIAAAMYVPSDPQEKAIANALGIQQELLFPERFDADGVRLHPVKHRRTADARNVKQKRVA